MNNLGGTVKTTREFDLLAACVVWPPSPERSSAISSLVDGDRVDWKLFEALTARHRVAALALNGLRSVQFVVPGEPGRILEANAHREALSELTLAGEVLRLNKAFVDGGLQPLLLKGVGIALEAYGKLGLRNNRDIDILIDVSQVSAAESILFSFGYDRIEPSSGMDDKALGRWISIHKDMVYLNPKSNAIVELHWRLFDNPRLMPVAWPFERTVIGYGGFEIAVMQKVQNIIYLCVHGSQHSWSRLKWLADLGAMLNSCPHSELLAIYKRSTDLGLRRPVALSFHLCKKLFGTSIPKEILDNSTGDWRLRFLLSISLASLAGGGVEELEEQRFGSTLKNISHYLLRDGVDYWLSEMEYDLHDDPGELGPNSQATALGRLTRWLVRHLRPSARPIAPGS